MHPLLLTKGVACLLAIRKKNGKMRIHRLEAGVLGWRLGAVGVGLEFKGGA